MLAQNKFVLRMVKLEMDRESIWVIHITDGHEYGFFKKILFCNTSFFSVLLQPHVNFLFLPTTLKRRFAVLKWPYILNLRWPLCLFAV